MHVQKAVERLGYTPHEAKVYLAALGLGESHVSDIAGRVKLPLSSVQLIVDKLHRDGLLNFYVRKRYKYWVAENPEHLLAKIREREDEIRAVLPQLESLRHGVHGKPRVKVFESVEEIRLIYDDILETKKHILGFIPWDSWVALLGRGFMEDFIEKRVRHFLRIRLLIPRSPLAQELRARDSKELRETRFLPKNFNIKTTAIIYGTKIVIVSLNKKLPTAILIDDPDICDTVTLFFE